MLAGFVAHEPPANFGLAQVKGLDDKLMKICAP